LALLLSLRIAAVQKTNAQLRTEMASNFPDNTVGAITPAGVRAFMSDFINSANVAELLDTMRPLSRAKLLYWNTLVLLSH